MSDQREDATPVVHGVVKWFDPAKGFGFILSDAGGPDILIHANVLRNYGQSSVADGSEIEVHVQHTARGRWLCACRGSAPVRACRSAAR